MPWIPAAEAALAAVLALPPDQMSLVVGEVLAAGPHQVRDDAKAQLEA